MEEDQQEKGSVLRAQDVVENQGLDVKEPQSQPKAEAPVGPSTLNKLFHRLDRVIPFLTVIILAATLYVYGRQAQIMKLQADIANRQAALAEQQREIANRQLQVTTRPYVATKIETDPTDVSANKLLVRNLGAYPVQNLRINFLYFAKIQDHGWWVTAPGGGPQRDKLSPQETWALDIKGYAKFFEQSFSSSFSVEGNLQFANFLISFERELDGRGYIYLEPMFVKKSQLFQQRDPLGGTIDNISGPLGNVCFPATELTFEYFRRRPLPRQYEIYNYEYLLGYQPTGCLGPIHWVR